MAVHIESTNPSSCAVIIPAEKARLVHKMEYDGERILPKGNRIDVDEGMDIPGEESDDDRPLILPGTVERLSLRRLKLSWFLNITGNFTKAQLHSKYGCVCRIWQALLIVMLFSYLAFAFGFVTIKDTTPTVVADGDRPFTLVHDAVWEIKWLLAFLMGISYYASGHVERFLAGVSLPSHVYRKGKHHGWIYLATVAFLIIALPSVLHAMQLHDLTKESIKGIIVCDSLYTLFRVATVPSFCVVTMVLYIIKVQIDSLGECLKCTCAALGVPYAKREITAVKRSIRVADTKLKWYLLCHMVLVLITAFTGVFSCIERLHITMQSGNGTAAVITVSGIDARHHHPNHLATDLIKIQLRMAQLDAQAPRYAVVNSYEEEDSRWQELKAAKMAALHKQLMNLTLQAIAESQMENLVPARNVTVRMQNKQGPSQVLAKFIDKEKPFRVLIESIVEFLEVIILFLLPLMLLAWHERAILRITEEIRDLDTEDQRRYGLLIDNEATQNHVITLLKDMRGVSIFGMRVQFYKAAFVTVLSPFIAAVLHLIFKKYKFY